jgi:MOSC domain-containing protein YiiM
LCRGPRRLFVARSKTSPTPAPCLKLATTFGVPETLDLTFEHGRTRRWCRVIWRTDDKLGVAFEAAEQAKAG